MSQLIECTVVLLMAQLAVSANLDPVQIHGNREIKICPLQEKRDVAIQNIKASIQTILQKNSSPPISPCGSVEWHRIAHLDMRNPSHRCSSSWREYSNNGIRGCRRPHSASASCHGTFYTVSRQYSRICGKVIGYQYGGTDGFGHGAAGQTIDSYYVYGVSVTRGSPRNHVWTFAAGASEGGFTTHIGFNCPCSNCGHPHNAVPPAFVGNNYYCESGNPARTVDGYHLYSTDPLWDGQQCEYQCCSNGKSPPWFSVELPNPSTDDIEVRICIGQPTYDDIVIQLLELYVL